MGVSPTKWSTVYMYTEVWLVSRLQKCTSWVCTRHPALWEILVVLCNGLRLEARGYLAIDNRHTCTLCCLVLWKNFVSSLSLHAVLFAWLRMRRNANSWSKHPLVRIQAACLRVHTWSGGAVSLSGHLSSDVWLNPPTNVCVPLLCPLVRSPCP